MKIVIASDLHGSAYYTDMLMNIYTKSGASQLVLLGDLLYHGPRNDLPRGYDCKKTAEILNLFSNSISCVRGNCDSEVDQMLLDFPIMADYALIYDGNISMFATHGHIYNKDRLPKLKEKSILLNGHFHVSEFSEVGEVLYVNPGSVSIPKGNMIRSCIIYEDGFFSLKNILDNSIISEKSIK